MAGWQSTGLINNEGQESQISGFPIYSRWDQEQSKQAMR